MIGAGIGLGIRALGEHGKAYRGENVKRYVSSRYFDL